MCAWRHGDYAIPYPTVHVGRFNAGIALNIVPNRRVLDFEIRNIATENPVAILARLHDAAAAIVERGAETASEAAIDMEVFNTYPGSRRPTHLKRWPSSNHSPARMARSRSPLERREAFFDNDLDLATLICGPGSTMQRHKPDEYITVEQMRRCDRMLETLQTHLIEGIS